MSKVFSVVSGKGGVGKSTVSANVAACLGEEFGKALIIELDFGLRGLDIMLGVENSIVYDAEDVISGRVPLKEACVQCDGNLYLLAAASGGQGIKDIQDIESLVASAKKDFDFIVLDCPAGMGEVVLAAPSLSDVVLLVTTPDPVCVRDAAHLVSLFPEDADIRLVINFADRKPRKNSPIQDLDDVMDMIGACLIGVLPKDDSISELAALGQRSSKDSLSGRIYKNIANRLCGNYVPLEIS